MEHPFLGNVTRHVNALDPDYESYSGMEGGPDFAPLESANVVTSELELPYGFHRPVLDIDFLAKLIPSSTPGKFHLYLDKQLSWEEYKELLEVMAKVGIIEEGYVRASIERGYTCVRLPWITKS